jgi:cobalt/nickel transport system permease protein
LHHAHIDKFAYQDSPIHRLDARTKLISTLVFTVLVLILPRQGVSVLACYAIWPFALLAIGRVPFRFVLRHILIVSVFVAVLALTMPFYNRTPVDVTFGPLHWRSTDGWLRCGAILGKFAVTMAALMALVSTSRFSDLLAALERLRVPQILVLQIGFLYRYIFVLVDRVHHMLRAKSARTLRNLGASHELSIASAMVGSLMLHSIDTAGRVGMAMEARGFDGEFRTINRMTFSAADGVFAFAFAIAMLILHLLVRPAFEVL